MARNMLDGFTGYTHIHTLKSFEVSNKISTRNCYIKLYFDASLTALRVELFGKIDFDYSVFGFVRFKIRESILIGGFHHFLNKCTYAVKPKHRRKINYLSIKNFSLNIHVNDILVGLLYKKNCT